MKRKIFFIAAAVLVAIALIAALLLLPKGNMPPVPDSTEPTEIAEQTLPATVEDKLERSVNLGYGLYMTEVGSYTGPFLEDGSDEFVSNVLMIRVTNKGETGIEYANISLAVKDGQASFTMSTLLPGETAVLLETNRRPFDSMEDYQYPLLDTPALFTKELSLQEDKLSVQLLEGGMNVTNISGSTIEGEIKIYYKNKQQGVYYGGITYCQRIAGNLEKDAMFQVISEHIHKGNTEIVFITVG